MAYQNFYSSKISTDIGAGDATITVDNAPTATSGRMVLEARNATQREIVKYTAVAGNVLTGVLRAQGGTTAKSHLKGALIEMNATAEDLQDLVTAFALANVVPSGVINPFAGSTSPAGWLLCDGAAVSRTTFSGLFTAIGTAFGAGDGSTTFALPNMSGRIPVGVGTATGATGATAHTRGQVAGEETHALTVTEQPYVGGSISFHNTAVFTNVAGASGAFNAGNVNANQYGSMTGQVGASSIGAVNFGNGGTNTPHNVMQPYLGLNYIIKT